jgi:PQQ-dependent catabolism-associated CXXCW motif protein
MRIKTAGMTVARRVTPIAGLWLAVLAVPAFGQDSFGGARPPVSNPPAPAAAQPPASVPASPPAPVLRTAPSFEPRGNPAGAPADRSAAQEMRDYGTPATRQLHAGPMHGPTPVSIPGGKVVTTPELMALLQSGAGQYLLLDVLGAPEMLPNALQAAWLAQPGTFDDAVQQQAIGAFQQATGGRKDLPIVLYCQSDHCWMSYNAALRAIAAGYNNVLWYRGGIEAWKAAGGSTASPQR